jgi:hypothetical protein
VHSFTVGYLHWLSGLLFGVGREKVEIGKLLLHYGSEIDAKSGINKERKEEGE